MDKVFLLRYDTERGDIEEMKGFFEKVIEVHKEHEIPATFFCTGGAIENREEDFTGFYKEVKNDPQFDIQDHSYSHIGLGYTDGMSVKELKADYERSFAAHKRVFSKKPVGISICGTGGRDGKRLNGFDETPKARRELSMVAELGVKMINSHLTEVAENREFCNYARIGHPDIMGFPSGYSDTSWMYRKEKGDPVEFITGVIRDHAEFGNHMPLMLHDWVAWSHAEDKELTHVKRITDFARNQKYTLKTHIECYDIPSLWV